MSQERDKKTGKKVFPNLEAKQVRIWHERWHRMHPETKEWQYNCIQAQKEAGFVGVRTLDYRKRFFPGGVDKKNAVPNHTIQGFAASIANRALIRLAEACPHRGWSDASGPFLQVHDYIGVLVPEARAEEAKRLVEECMYYEYMGMPFPGEAIASKSWADQG